MNILLSPFQKSGALTLNYLQQLGTFMIMVLTIPITLYKISYRQTIQSLYDTAVRAMPIVLMTGLFVGAIMVIQMGFYVRSYQINDAMGWGVGMLTLREINPLMVALMFSGRIGAFNCAELGTMSQRDQIIALRLLNINPIPYLVTPRLIGSMVMIVALMMMAHLIAIITALITGRFLLNLPYITFLSSFYDYIQPEDLTVGIIKAISFGAIISLISSFYGLYTNKTIRQKIATTVLISCSGIFLIDFLINQLIP